VEKFAQHFDRSPEHLGSEEVREFLVSTREGASYAVLSGSAVAPVDVLRSPVFSVPRKSVGHGEAASSGILLSNPPLHNREPESDAFLRILEYARSTRQGEQRLELTGGLCRFHAAGKTLYSPHLMRFFDEAGAELLDEATKGRIDALLAGSSRLSRATPEKRAQAAALAQDLRKRFEQVELEQIRGGDAPDDRSFERREKAQNLSWFLDRQPPHGAPSANWMTASAAPPGSKNTTNFPTSGTSVGGTITFPPSSVTFVALASLSATVT